MANQIDFKDVASVEADENLQLITGPVSYTHLRAHETVLDLVCRLLLEKKKNQRTLSMTTLCEEPTNER